jgi:uncharacterized protein involved in outer membrane biogenesis
VTVIAVLLAALVGPFLIDWTAYRTTFERYGEQLLGHRVAVMGEAEMRLLPTPMLTFSDVRVGEPEDPLLAVSRFEMRIELPPLLKGEVRIIDMTLDRPALRLSIDEQGRLDWFTALARNGLIAEVDPDLVMLEQANIRDGRLTVIDARSGQSHNVEDIDLVVAARSMLGPFKLDGMASFMGQRATVVLATGRGDGAGGVRLRAGITPVAFPVDLVMDGRLGLADGRPGYEGAYTFTSVTPEDQPERAWRSEGKFALDIGKLALSESTLRYGPEERPVTLEGGLDLKLAVPYRFDLAATAKQIDLDRISGRGPQRPLSVAESGKLLLDALRALPHPPIEGAVEISVPALVSGGGLAQDISLTAERLAGGWRIAELAGRLPGRTEFLALGDLGLQPRSSFRGSFAISVAQPAVFSDWWRKGAVAGVAATPFAMEARIDAVSDAVSLTDLLFEIGQDTGRGAVSWSTPADGPPRFEADLDAKRLDGDQALKLARLFLGTEGGLLDGVAGTGSEVSLRLFAEEADFGSFVAETLSVRSTYRDGALVIEDASIADLSGARVTASGRIDGLTTTPTGALDFGIDADRVDGIAALLLALDPDNRLLREIASRPHAFSPARLSLAFQGEATGSGRAAATRASVAVTGEAGGTGVEVNLGLEGRLDAWRAASVDFEAGFGTPDGTALLAQVGIPTLPVASPGEARIEIGGAGIPEQGLEGHARVYLGQAALTAVGSLVLPAQAPPVYEADIVARAPDLLPLALLTGRLPSLAVSSGAVDLVAALKGKGDAFTLSNLSGSVAGTRVDADLQIDLRTAMASLDPRVRGSLDLSEVDLAELGDLVLGADQLAETGAGAWSSAAFGPPVLSGLDLSVDLSARRMSFPPAPLANDVKGRLGFKDGALTLEVEEGGFAGGSVSGTYALKRTDGQAALAATLRVENAELGELVWTRSGRPVANGRLALNLDFEGTGRSIAGIVSGLSGGGTMRVEDGEIRGLNPDAFALVIRAVDAGLDLGDEAIRDAFSSHLDAGRLPFEVLEANASIAGGVVRIGNARVDNAAATLFGNAQVDLEKLALQSDFSLKVDPGEDAVTGAEAQVGLVFVGPLAEPQRSIDIAPFTAFLTLRAFEQEVRRVEELQAEITERDRLMREMRRMREQERRRERDKELEEERARDDAARAEEAARAAEKARAADIERERAAAAAREKAAREEAARAEAERARAAQERNTRNRATAAPSAAPSPSGETGQVGRPADFGDQIRRALRDLDGSGTLQPPPDQAGKPLQLLPPLDPPVFIGVTPDR